MVSGGNSSVEAFWWLEGPGQEPKGQRAHPLTRVGTWVGPDMLGENHKMEGTSGSANDSDRPRDETGVSTCFHVCCPPTCPGNPLLPRFPYHPGTRLVELITSPFYVY